MKYIFILIILFSFQAYGYKDKQYKCRMVDIKLETIVIDSVQKSLNFLQEGYALGCFKTSEYCRELIGKMKLSFSLFKSFSNVSISQIKQLIYKGYSSEHAEAIVYKSKDWKDTEKYQKEFITKLFRFRELCTITTRTE